MRLVVAGTLVGAFAAVIASRFVTSLLYEVSPFDPLALLGGLALLAGVSYAAAFVPAFQVARIDPTTVLRQE
jgi:putative ABC transport system permease protein